MEKIDLGPQPVRNVSVFVIGTIVSAFGTVMATDTKLGVTPSAALPYVAEMSTGMSLGMATFIMQIVFFALGLFFIGKKNFKLVFLLTIPTLILYSLACDVFMMLPGVRPSGYISEWAIIIIATFFHALGISLQLASNLSMVPLDMFANILSMRYEKDYGIIKVCVDVSLVALAVLLSFMAFGELRGVRGGTVFAAIFVGLIVSALTRLYVKYGFYEWVGHLKHLFKDQ